MPFTSQIRRTLVAEIFLLALLLPVLAFASGNGSDAYPEVTTKRLLGAANDDGWLMYRRDYDSTGYAPFRRINTRNVGRLEPAFEYSSGLTQGHQSPPVVNGRYLFVTTPLNRLIALDATNGTVLWEYRHPVDEKALRTVCCDVVNRGVALYADLVYMGTLDNKIVALEASTGKVRWETTLAPPGVGFFITSAPLIVDGKLIIGDGGGEYGARGFITALDALTGAVVWKTFTTAAPGTPGGDTWEGDSYKIGGGSPWITGSYDRDTHTLFWGVGNPSPWLAELRPGLNLYVDSVLALNPDTGEIRWHYQWTPHNSWDYDGANENVLTNIRHRGRSYKALVHADRNGWFYALDRTNGKLIYARPFVHATSIASMKDGVPQPDPERQPTMQKEVFTCPSFIGGKNWWPVSIDPRARRVYIPALHACMTIQGIGRPPRYNEGRYYVGAQFELKRDPTAHYWGSVEALDLNTGKTVWQHQTALPWTSGVLTTAGGLVFAGRSDGYLTAFDARSGKVLWRSEQMSSGIVGVPTTYVVDGKQYVAIWAGWGGAVPMWGGEIAKDAEVMKIQKGGRLYVFRL